MYFFFLKEGHWKCVSFRLSKIWIHLAELWNKCTGFNFLVPTGDRIMTDRTIREGWGFSSSVTGLVVPLIRSHSPSPQPILGVDLLNSRTCCWHFIFPSFPAHCLLGWPLSEQLRPHCIPSLIPCPPHLFCWSGALSARFRLLRTTWPSLLTCLSVAASAQASCGFELQLHHEFTVGLGQITDLPIKCQLLLSLCFFVISSFPSHPCFCFRVRGMCLPFKGRLWRVTLNPPLGVFSCFLSARRLSIFPPYNHTFPTALPDPLVAVSFLKEWSLPAHPASCCGPRPGPCAPSLASDPVGQLPSPTPASSSFKFTCFVLPKPVCACCAHFGRKQKGREKKTLIILSIGVCIYIYICILMFWYIFF